MFKYSSIYDNVQDFLENTDEGDILCRQSCLYIRKVFNKLLSVGIISQTDFDDIMSNVTTVVKKNFLRWLSLFLVDCDILDIYILCMAINITAQINIIPEEEFIHNKEYSEILIKLESNGYDNRFLKDAYNSLIIKDFRSCITHLYSVVENLLKKKLNESNDNSGLKCLIQKAKSNNLISDECYIMLDKVRDDRNKKGAHGSLIYDELDKDTMKKYFNYVLKAIDLIIS